MGHHCNCHGHCHCHSHRCIFGCFLGFLTGVIWLLIALSGKLTEFFGLIELGSLGHILIIIIAIIGFLAFLVFGFYVFKKAWRCCR
ncbi:ABC transporter [Neobacillus pocheonensis]|uniref:ABC transporter n=1 Tax=Neobacillus pocheonensis TaxID=363869 RepID=UPI003D28EF82